MRTYVPEVVDVLSYSACAVQVLGVLLRGDTDWHVTMMEQDHDVIAGGSAVGIALPTPQLDKPAVVSRVS